MRKAADYIRDLEAENTFLRAQLKEREKCRIIADSKQWRRLPNIPPEKTGPNSEWFRNFMIRREFDNRKAKGEKPGKILADMEKRKGIPRGDTLKKIVHSKKYQKFKNGGWTKEEIKKTVVALEKELKKFPIKI